MKRETVYSLEGVTFSYPGGLCGVREVDLEICLGEEVVLLGANGTGKSTLLRILGGLIFPDEGRVTFRGISLDPETVRDSVFRSSFRQQVCILFQDPEVQLFCSSVREEVLFGPTQLGLPFEQSDMRVRELISLFGLEQVAERQPFRMSHGEKKKVAIAALLAVNPSVLLLDEPTAGLDPASWELVMDLIDGLHRAGKTIVTATHDIHAAAGLGERVIIFGESKRPVADGIARELLSDERLLQENGILHRHLHRHGPSWHRHRHDHREDEGS